MKRLNKKLSKPTSFDDQESKSKDITWNAAQRDREVGKKDSVLVQSLLEADTHPGVQAHLWGVGGARAGREGLVWGRGLRAVRRGVKEGGWVARAWDPSAALWTPQTTGHLRKVPGRGSRPRTPAGGEAASQVLLREDLSAHLHGQAERPQTVRMLQVPAHSGGIPHKENRHCGEGQNSQRKGLRITHN